MHALSPAFMDALQSGFLADLRRKVVEDPDLDLEIRKDYLNIYFKGNSLLKLTEAHSPNGEPSRYLRDIHPKFLDETSNIPEVLTDHQTTEQFLQNVPTLKRNITIHGKQSRETEYEQLLIRANNGEDRNNSEYFIIDRQYAVGTDKRFDLLAVCWDRKGRRRGQKIPLCLMELKFALNRDIADVHEQLTRYHAAVTPQVAGIAEEAETVFRQKLALGLYRQSAERLAAMKTLTILRDPSRVQYILVLIDYNPHANTLNLARLARLPFASQIRLFRTGFAMWQSRVEGLESLVTPAAR